MNRDRQQQVDVMAVALSTETSAAQRKLAMKNLDKLAVLEQVSIEKMMPHREKGSTAANINKAERSLEALRLAHDLVASGDTKAASTVLQTIAGMSNGSSKPTFKATPSEPELWPGDSPELSVVDRHRAAVALYKEWDRMEKENRDMQNPRFISWLHDNGHDESYNYLRSESRLPVDHATGIFSEGYRAGYSNRPEDYE